MKNNKLYTVNRWNRPAFMPEGNLFLGGGGLWNGGNSGFIPFDSDAAAKDVESVKGIQFNPTQANNVFSKGLSLNQQIARDGYNPGTVGQQIDSLTTSSSDSGVTKSVSIKPTTIQAIGMASNFMDSIPTGDKRGMWDTLDPMHHLAGGRESAVGNVLGDTGVGLFKAGAQSGNPWLMLAGGVSKFLGSGINGLFGTKVDKVALDRANTSINTNKNFVSNAETLDELRGPASMTQADVYTGSLFNSADDKNEALRRDMRSAFNWADASIRNNARNIISDKYEDNMRRFSAFGGPLDIAVDNNDMGAINYGFMQDYLTNKKQEISNRNKMAGLTQMPAFMPNSFAIGGDLQTNKRKYSLGKIYDVSEKEANLLKAMGYEFTVIN